MPRNLAFFHFSSIRETPVLTPNKCFTALPKGVNAGGNLTWFAFDPQHNLLYTMQMTSDLYRLKLER